MTRRIEVLASQPGDIDAVEDVTVSGFEISVDWWGGSIFVAGGLFENGAVSAGA